MSFPKKLIPATDPILTTVATAVDISDLAFLQELADGLERNLKRTTGIGLALPQVGISLRGFHLSGSLFMPRKHRFCFNPSIVTSSPTSTSFDEGCLSLPGKLYSVSRPEKITVHYFNEKGKPVTENLTDLAAKAFQHELDHLNGILISSKGTLIKEISV